MNNLTPVIAGISIPVDSEGRYNLNALHKASGGNTNKAPAQWMRTQQSREIVQEVIDMQICTSPIDSVKGGLTQGTFAHELLAVSYAGWISPKFQLQVNQAFLDMKSGKLKPVSELSRMDLIMMAKEAEEEKLLLLDQINETKPIVEAFDRISKADGSMCITDAAKALQIRPKDLFAWLQANHWIYRRTGASHWCGHADKLQQSVVEHKITVVSRTDGSEKTTEQVRITAKGIAKIAKLMSTAMAA